MIGFICIAIAYACYVWPGGWKEEGREGWKKAPV